MGRYTDRFATLGGGARRLVTVTPLPCCVCGQENANVRCFRWYEDQIKRAVKLGYELEKPQATQIHQKCADWVVAFLVEQRKKP
jgi:hypothetical protein